MLDIENRNFYPGKNYELLQKTYSSDPCVFLVGILFVGLHFPSHFEFGYSKTLSDSHT